VFINLIQSDVGRPVGHIVSNLVGYSSLVADTQAVLNTLIPKELSVQTTAGKWYKMNIQPYRTLENVIEGAVITFVDISETKRAKEALRKANELLLQALVARDPNVAITVQDLDGRILAWNPAAVRMYGWSEAEAMLMNARDRVPEEVQNHSSATLLQPERAEIPEPFLARRITREGRVLEVWITATALVNEAGQMYAIATTERARESKMGRAKEGHNEKKE
jgi:two-component system CheB/CheR fusion protein